MPHFNFKKRFKLWKRNRDHHKVSDSVQLVISSSSSAFRPKETGLQQDTSGSTKALVEDIDPRPLPDSSSHPKHEHAAGDADVGSHYANHNSMLPDPLLPPPQILISDNDPDLIEDDGAFSTVSPGTQSNTSLRQLPSDLSQVSSKSDPVGNDTYAVLRTGPHGNSSNASLRQLPSDLPQASPEPWSELPSGNRGPDAAWNKAQWIRAYEIAKNKLNPEEQTQLPADVQSIEKETVISIIGEAQNIRDRKIAAQLTYTNKRGQTVRLREKVDTLIKDFNAYARIVDIAVGHQPEVTSLVWGSVRFLLQVYINHSEAVDAVTEAMEKIVSAMGWAYFYASMFYNALNQDDGGGLSGSGKDSASASGFYHGTTAALPEFYASILVFSIKARSFFAPAGVFRRAASALKPFSEHFQDCINEVEEKEKVLKDLAEMATMKRMKAIHDFMLYSAPSWRAALQALQVPLSVTPEEDKKALQWLNAVDPSSLYRYNRERRLKGTCAWIFRENVFQTWDAGQDKGNLCISGIPGAGKSVLATALIDHLKSKRDGSRVLYFFFSAGDQLRINPVDMLASLIAQLIKGAPGDKEVVQMKQILRERVEESSSFALSHASGEGREFEKLCDLFLDMARNSTSRVNLVLDALDECSTPNLVAEFVDKVTRSYSAQPQLDQVNCGSNMGVTSARIRIVLTGRPDVIQIHFALPSFSNISMDVDEDIGAFVEDRVTRNKALCAHKEKIKDAIFRNATGMFRYAALALEELEVVSLEPIRKRIAALPKGIFGMYESILNRLSTKGGNAEAEIRRRVVMWCLSSSADQPSTEYDSDAGQSITILQRMCVMVPGDTSFDAEEFILPTEEQILAACGPLVNIRDGGDYRKMSELWGSGRTVTFSHKTVRDFFLRDKSTLVPDMAANSSIARLFTTLEEAEAFKAVCMLTLLLSIPREAEDLREQFLVAPYRGSVNFLNLRTRCGIHAVPKGKSATQVSEILWILLARLIWDIDFERHFAAFLFALHKSENAMHIGLVASAGREHYTFYKMVRDGSLYLPPEFLLAYYDLTDVVDRYSPPSFSFTNWVLDCRTAERFRFVWEADSVQFSSEAIPYDSMRDIPEDYLNDQFFAPQVKAWSGMTMLELLSYYDAKDTARLVIERHGVSTEDSSLAVAVEYGLTDFAKLLIGYTHDLNSEKLCHALSNSGLYGLRKISSITPLKLVCYKFRRRGFGFNDYQSKPAVEEPAENLFYLAGTSNNAVVSEPKDPLKYLETDPDYRWCKELYVLLRSKGAKTYKELGLRGISWDKVVDLDGRLVDGKAYILHELRASLGMDDIHDPPSSDDDDRRGLLADELNAEAEKILAAVMNFNEDREPVYMPTAPSTGTRNRFIDMDTSSSPSVSGVRESGLDDEQDAEVGGGNHAEAERIVSAIRTFRDVLPQWDR